MAENLASSPSPSEDQRPDTKGKDAINLLEQKVQHSENLLIGIIIVLLVGFVTMIVEVGYIIHDDWKSKEQSYLTLLEKVHQQDILIENLMRDYGNKK